MLNLQKRSCREVGGLEWWEGCMRNLPLEVNRMMSIETLKHNRLCMSSCQDNHIQTFS